jgi:predicted amidophosphoribosyltransferase
VVTPLDLLLPPRCAVCTRPGPLLCSACVAAMPLHAGPTCARCGAPTMRPVAECTGCRGRRLGYESASAGLLFEGPARRLVHAFKDGGLRGLDDHAAALTALVVAPPDAAVVTWVPSDPLRLVLRGYHPAERLAQRLAARWGLPAVPLLRAQLWRRPQRGLTRAARRANVRRAFTVTAPVAGRICLVDDVHTTGATLEAAARALRRGGASAVVAVTLARADRA